MSTAPGCISKIAIIKEQKPMQPITSGIIKKQNSIQKTYEMVALEECHLPDIMTLQEIITNSLRDTQIFNSSSEEFMRRHIREKGKMIGVFVENELIAYHALYFPESDETDYDMRADLSFSETPQIHTIANFQDVLVHPDFRGNHLGVKMNKQALQSLNHTEYRHLFATVSPFNTPSIRLFFDSGFFIRELKNKYGKKLRYIFYKDIRKSPRMISETEVLLGNEMIQAQQDVLSKGYWGIGFRNIGEQFDIKYQFINF
jgi:ribosomal protein S18 acetylase RimI-like enzyme